MPSRNRVDPWGDIHRTPARGLLTGNRGCLVDDNGGLLRHHRGSLWIICRIAYKDWRHPLTEPGTWTPLFFLDDAVALAAGHRPCGLCRRPDYQSYRDAIIRATAPHRRLLAPDLNRLLASQRLRASRGLNRAKHRILTRMQLQDLPTGTVIADPATGESQLVTERYLQVFTFHGWAAPARKPLQATVDVLTPPASVTALANGFLPRLHPTVRH